MPRGAGAPGAPAILGIAQDVLADATPSDAPTEDFLIIGQDPGGAAVALPRRGETPADPLIDALRIDELPTWIALVPVDADSSAHAERARLLGALPKHTIETDLVLPALTPTD